MLSQCESTVVITICVATPTATAMESWRRGFNPRRRTHKIFHLRIPWRESVTLAHIGERKKLCHSFGKLEARVQSLSAHPQNFPSPDSVAGICNSSSHRGEEKALPQFRQGSGPVTSCMHACSGSGRHVIPLMIDIRVTMY